jgi:hypothetical protein
MTAPRVRLDIDATRDKLAALGCGHAAAALEPLLAEAVRSELAAHLFLDRLLDAEQAGREERRVRTMLKSSKWSCPGLVDSSGAFGVGRLCVGPFVLDGGLVSEGRVTA